jgi:hypothetical protein
VERKRLLLFVCAAVALCAAAPNLGQEEAQEPVKNPRLQGHFTVRRPAQGVDLDAIKGEMATSTTLPLWTFDAHSSRDGQSYPGVMVGLDPFNNPGSVSVVTNVIPLIIKTNTIAVSFDSKTGIITTKPGLTTFNPSAADTACLTAPNNVPTKLFEESPILNAATFDFGGTIVGRTQYIDAFQRGNFWKALSSNVSKYHVLLKANFLDPIVINVPTIYGTALTPAFVLAAFGPPPDCGTLGVVNIGWFDNYVTGTLIPALAAKGVNPTTFPIFLVHNLVWAGSTTNLFTCCALGYHGVTGFPTPTQTYSPLDFESSGFFATSSGPILALSDTAVASHEVGEWMNDPFTINPTPLWGHTGQVGGCQGNLEVGDPLTGTEAPRIWMPNGFTYHLQELAFFRWFFGAPSISVNGWYSNNGTFLTDAGPPCH